MSGTSLDGIDAAVIETDGEVVTAVGENLSVPYNSRLRPKLRDLLNGDGEVQTIEKELTKAHADAVNELLKKANLTNNDIDLIGFHGQTIFHDPKNQKTVQIGDGQLLAELTGIDVVNDFRTNDVKNGGEGAPFAPLYHAALAENEKLPVAIVNIGGVGNITWIGKGGGNIIAFDTGPGNAMIDDLMFKNTGKPYDEGGKIAASGNVNQAVLSELLQDEYFARKVPKSLDRNHFDCSAANELSIEDGVATLSAFTIESIAKAVEHFPSPPVKYYVTGGGRHNSYIMSGLAKLLKIPVVKIEEIGTNGDMLEAEAFAFLAVRSFYGLPLSLPSTTGVKEPLTGGVLHQK